MSLDTEAWESVAIHFEAARLKAIHMWVKVSWAVKWVVVRQGAEEGSAVALHPRLRGSKELELWRLVPHWVLDCSGYWQGLPRDSRLGSLQGMILEDSLPAQDVLGEVGLRSE